LLHGPRSVRRLPEFLPPDRKVLVVTDPGLRADKYQDVAEALGADIAGLDSRQT
jgi:hypothetical protein